MLKHILAPMARRVGTFIAGSGVGIAAVDPQLLADARAGLVAIALIGIDLLLSRLSKMGGGQ